jgi:hypothetical protein
MQRFLGCTEAGLEAKKCLLTKISEKATAEIEIAGLND